MRLETAEDTARFGARLAGQLRRGDLLVLTGPLGAGKTALTQGIGAGLGVGGDIISPTFVIARVHPPVWGNIPLVHADAYRLSGIAELDDLDLDETVEDSVTVVEWGAGMAERLNETYLEIQIDRNADDSRTVTLHGHGADWTERIEKLETEC